ncbi:hypothetical protein, partial [Massilia sp. TSP1-1-2]|uniref:hypothetical protein n=1 Tax=Massilia sp. TSP1-1-2 TaxID=2804649 RepID=UPI003CF19C14
GNSVRGLNMSSDSAGSTTDDLQLHSLADFVLQSGYFIVAGTEVLGEGRQWGVTCRSVTRQCFDSRAVFAC